MVNMCSGGNHKRWVEVEKHGVVVINIDTQLGVNALDPHVGGLARRGDINGKDRLVDSRSTMPHCQSFEDARRRRRRTTAAEDEERTREVRQGNKHSITTRTDRPRLSTLD